MTHIKKHNFKFNSDGANLAAYIGIHPPRLVTMRDSKKTLYDKIEKGWEVKCKNRNKELKKELILE